MEKLYVLSGAMLLLQGTVPRWRNGNVVLHGIKPTVAGWALKALHLPTNGFW